MKEFPENHTNSPRSASRARVVACGFALAAVAAIFLIGLSNRGDARGKEGVEVAIRPDLPATAAAIALADDDKPEPGTGTLRGVVTFKGAAPKRRVIVAKGDPKIEKEEDRKVCAAEDLLSDELIVNESADNGVANVCIYLRNLPSGYKAPAPPEEPAVFDQKGCRFIPHVLFVRAKQKVLIKSGDPLVHNTHTNPVKNTGFNKAISPEDREGQPLTYDKGESVPVSVNCDYHKWMKGWHLVLDHPFGAITDENGKFEIKGLPPGKYEFVVWHESPGYLDRKLAVEIKADKVTEEKLSYTAAKFKVAK
jgi:hypothetical protein